RADTGRDALTRVSASKCVYKPAKMLEQGLLDFLQVGGETEMVSAPGQIRESFVSSQNRAGEIVMEARELTKVYGSGEKSLIVLREANLELKRGEMVAIVAPSGAGKSTLLHLLAALDTPTSGAIYFDSKQLETKNEATLAEFRNRSVGFLWQRHQLLPDFTAAGN